MMRSAALPTLRADQRALANVSIARPGECDADPLESRYPARATRRAVVAAEVERISDSITAMADLLRGPRSEARAGYRRHRAESVGEWTP